MSPRKKTFSFNYLSIVFNEGGSVFRGDVIQVNARGVAITPAIECANGTKVSEVETSRYKVINSKNSVRWV